MAISFHRHTNVSKQTMLLDCVEVGPVHVWGWLELIHSLSTSQILRLILKRGLPWGVCVCVCVGGGGVSGSL